MEHSEKKTQTASAKTASVPGGIKQFAIKAGIVTVLLLTLVNSVLPDFDKLKRFDNPKTKLLLLGLIQNPRALLKVSEIEEGEGKLDNAIREMELAVGLLEMHGSSKEIVAPYLERINKLNSQKPHTLPNGSRQ